MEERGVLAAGAVVSTSRKRVLLVHRPRYDDWSFPKGKVDPGEHLTATAVREVAEETGLDIRLGVPLPTQSYATGSAGTTPKTVHYWAARAVGGEDVSGYRPNAEIDQVAWVPYEEALTRLSYDHDRDLLETWYGRRKRTRTLVVLRHGQALPRGSWDGPDPDRLLSPAGGLQSEALVPILAAYGVTDVVTSTSRRCVDTVTPFVATASVRCRQTPDLSEEGASRSGVEAVVEELLAATDPALLCTHRPVLGKVLGALGLPREPLEPAGMLVVHHRTNRRGERTVLAVEHHAVPG